MCVCVCVCMCVFVCDVCMSLLLVASSATFSYRTIVSYCLLFVYRCTSQLESLQELRVNVPYFLHVLKNNQAHEDIICSTLMLLEALSVCGQSVNPYVPAHRVGMAILPLSLKTETEV